ncbi:vanadium-dependent haloperoxidase [Legionella antarctica]|nr:vanadium-dependent haloperoxidase [Legionella antarctica]
MVIIILLIISILVGIYAFTTPKITSLPTYFTYKGEQAALNNLHSSQKMTAHTTKKWDGIMFDLVKSHKLGDATASRIYAYLYTAQRDAAFLSHNNKHRFMGSLDPISAEVLCLFFPKNCPHIKFQVKTDPYSNELAKIVLKKIKLHMILDTKQQKLSAEKPGGDHWAGSKPYFGQEVGSWKPWIIDSPQQFLAPKPNAQLWQDELRQTEQALQNITPNQTKAVVFWAGNPSTITPPGIWLTFANEYIEEEHVSFSKALFVRSVLAMGIADSVIAVFYSKYTYWIKRPFMLNPNIYTVMPTPNHPSYPAGHSTISATAAVILSYFFPKNTQNWWEKADEASSSRVWGGIHFPVDAKEGLILGRKVGNTVIQAQPPFALELDKK